MLLEIIKDPNPILRQKNLKVKNPLEPATQELILSMIETMRQAQGIGLAANQVGVNLRICVIEIEEKLLIMINPKITAKSSKKITADEGCLSFPDKFLPISRASQVQVRYLDQAGQDKKIKATGLLARALQHEIDHLDGVLFIDRIDKKAQKKTAKIKAHPIEKVQNTTKIKTKSSLKVPSKDCQHKLRVVFMGTSELSAKILEALLAHKYNVVGVFTKADKKIGRSQTLTCPAVKLIAEQNKLPVFQPTTFKNPASVDELKNLKPDLIVVAAFGKILPKNVLEIPSFGCLNVHVSLLPKYRGPSPVQNALLCGEKETGTTIMLMDEGIDTGDILAQKKMPIESSDNTASLMQKLAIQGAETLLEILPAWIERKIQPQKQDHAKASLCQLIEREDGHINWDEDAEIIFNKYRALTPWPGIFTFYKNESGMIRIKLIEIQWQQETAKTTKQIGEVFRVNENEVGVQTARGIILIKQLQREGKKISDLATFLNGHPNFIGKILF